MAKKSSRAVFFVKAEISMLLPDSEELASVELRAGWFRDLESARMWAVHFYFGCAIIWQEAVVTNIEFWKIEAQFANDSVLDIDIREINVFEAARTLDDIIIAHNKKNTP